MDMSTNKQLRPFGMRDKIGYAFGDFGCNMSFAFINSYLMLFYVTCMKIDPKHFAVLILLGKIFDAINDPIIGGLCDATKPGKDGKFKPWIKWASPVLLLSSIALFIYAPSAPYGVKIAMCLGIYCLWSVAYTSVNVPYGSMQSCITNDPAGRSSLSQWRSIGAMCAQIPIMILLPLLVYDKNDNPRGELFIIFVGVMGAIGLVSFYLLRRMTTERIAAAQPQEKQKFNYFSTLGSFFKNKPMMGVTIDPHMAGCLYTGMATDTGCFRFSNTTAETHKAAAALIEAGADVERLNERLFESRSHARVIAERMALESLEFYYDDRCALICLTWDQIQAAGVAGAELEDLTSLPRSIEGVEVGLTLRQQKDGSFKISVRTGHDTNACNIARRLGGGGHPRAAGCEISGNPDNAKHAILEEVKKELDRADAEKAQA